MQLQETASPEESFLRLSETAVVHVQVLVDFTKRLPGKFLPLGNITGVMPFFFLRGRKHPDGMNLRKMQALRKLSFS